MTATHTPFADTHELVLFAQDPASGYRGIIAIHDSTLGPALGGTRFWSYASVDDALTDALRLAKGMTYKAAAAGLDLGGGKAVILGDNRRTDREALFRAHGRAVESLGGRYITAEDVGTSPGDMDYVRAETRHVGGLIGQSGDPSPVTGLGVFHGLRAAVKHHFGTDDLAGRTVAVQGAGKVAYYLCRHLHAAGARLVATDIDAARAQRLADEFGATLVAPDAIYDVAADVYSPNALGATLNDATLARLRAPVIAGGANNQLAEPRHGDLLAARGVTYAPDFVVNAGGIINLCREVYGWSEARAFAKAEAIYETVGRVFARAATDKIPSSVAADRLAEERIAAVRAVRGFGARPRP